MQRLQRALGALRLHSQCECQHCEVSIFILYFELALYFNEELSLLLIYVSYMAMDSGTIDSMSYNLLRSSLILLFKLL